MNIREIAQLAGVSVATVSRVINHSPKVSEESREKVLSVMEEYHYTPNVFAQGLNTNSIKTVGILCPEISDINHAAAVSILEAQLRAKGFDSLLCCVGGLNPAKSTCVRLLTEKRVDAIFMIGSDLDERKNYAVYKEAARQAPILVLNGFIDLPGIYNINCDDCKAIYEVCQDLEQAGSRNLLFIEDSNTYSASRKRKGYLDYISSSGKSPDLQIAIPPQKHMEALSETRAAVSALLESGSNVDAVIATDDILAIGAMQALQHSGIRIPVVGYNNSEFALCCTPALSSVDNQIDIICSMAVDTMMNLADGKEAAGLVTVSARLVERETFQKSSIAI